MSVYVYSIVQSGLNIIFGNIFFFDFRIKTLKEFLFAFFLFSTFSSLPFYVFAASFQPDSKPLLTARSTGCEPVPYFFSNVTMPLSADYVFDTKTRTVDYQTKTGTPINVTMSLDISSQLRGVEPK